MEKTKIWRESGAAGVGECTANDSLLSCRSRTCVSVEVEAGVPEEDDRWGCMA